MPLMHGLEAKKPILAIFDDDLFSRTFDIESPEYNPYHTLVVHVYARCYLHRIRLRLDLCSTVQFLGQGLRTVQHLTVLD